MKTGGQAKLISAFTLLFASLFPVTLCMGFLMQAWNRKIGDPLSLL